jgi:hypothetical protein
MELVGDENEAHWSLYHGKEMRNRTTGLVLPRRQVSVMMVLCSMRGMQT